MSRKNWIAVASAEHARRGCAEPLNGYMQVCHGKCAPLKRMSPGDLVTYYSPTLRMGGGDRLQRFVSLGIVQPGEPYAFDMGGGFTPFRRDVAYVAAEEASIQTLLEQFDFVEDPQRWGYKFRFGLFDISDHDMRLIARAMRADLKLLGLEAHSRLSAARATGATSLRQASLIA
ncbi:MAG: EVE domain-containing protein [Polaromonas sp.]|nr:EVE domain-containing protein [Polaromonas sp.]